MSGDDSFGGTALGTISLATIIYYGNTTAASRRFSNRDCGDAGGRRIVQLTPKAEQPGRSVVVVSLHHIISFEVLSP